MNDIEALRRAIRKEHGCDALHMAAVPIVEAVGGYPVWDGTVEVFAVQHHDAKTCYAWNYPCGETNKDTTCVTVLGKPPIDSPEQAVREFIVSESARR